MRVTCAGELWWREWVRSRIADGSTRHLIVHLINPPAGEEIDADGSLLPPPATDVGVTVRVPRGQTLRQAIVLDPLRDDRAHPLRTNADQSSVHVTVPRVDRWTVVVFEFGGTFAVPRPVPRFTDPPEPAEVDAGRTDPPGAMSEGPLPPLDTPEGRVRRWLYETDTSYHNVMAVAVQDAGASNDRAQARLRGSVGSYWGRTSMGPFAPGRYVARARLKFIPDPDGPQQQDIVARLYLYETEENPAFETHAVSPEVESQWPVKQILDGQCHEYEIPFERNTIGPVSIIGYAWLPEPDDSEFFADHIVIEQRERYSDAKLAEMTPLARPEGLTVGGAPGLDIHVVKGLWWDTYRLPEALAAITTPDRISETWVNQDTAEAFPTRHEGLFGHDAVVLANADAQWLGYPGRRVLADFVSAGGGLVVLGGAYCFGEGNFTQTLLEEMLPVAVRDGADLERAPAPLALRPGAAGWATAGITPEQWAVQPTVLWRHRVMPRAGAEVALLAGDEPVLLGHAHGRGRVAVFTGTVHGETAAAELPFWEWDACPRLLANVIRWAAPTEG